MATATKRSKKSAVPAPVATETPNSVSTTVESVMDSSRPFEVNEVNRKAGTVTITLRGNLLGPVGDCLIEDNGYGHFNTRYSLGRSLMTCRRIMRGEDPVNTALPHVNVVG